MKNKVTCSSGHCSPSASLHRRPPAAGSSLLLSSVLIFDHLWTKARSTIATCMACHRGGDAFGVKGDNIETLCQRSNRTNTLNTFSLTCCTYDICLLRQIESCNRLLGYLASLSAGAIYFTLLCMGGCPVLVLTDSIIIFAKMFIHFYQNSS